MPPPRRNSWLSPPKATVPSSTFPPPCHSKFSCLRAPRSQPTLGPSLCAFNCPGLWETNPDVRYNPSLYPGPGLLLTSGCSTSKAKVADIRTPERREACPHPAWGPHPCPSLDLGKRKERETGGLRRAEEKLVCTSISGREHCGQADSSRAPQTAQGLRPAPPSSHGRRPLPLPGPTTTPEPPAGVGEQGQTNKT